MKKPNLSRQLKGVLVIYGLLAAVFLIMVAISPTYRSIENIGNILIQSAPLAVVSLGQTIVMLGGGIDMSVGSTISLVTCIAAVVMKGGTGIHVVLALGIVLLAAVAIGALNGIGINYCKVPPMITTLSMMIVLSGVAQAVLPVAGGSINRSFAQAVMARFGIASVPLLVLLVVFLVLRQLLYKSRLGVSIYAIGGNAKIAASMGIKAPHVSIMTYVIAALCAAVTGILLASRMRIGDPLTGTTFGLDSITAAAIGGTALTGGVGLISGTIAGAFLIGMLSNMMNILGVNHFFQYVLKGLLLVVAMIIYALSARLEVKRSGK